MHGLTLLDAQVLGTKQPAEEGKLVILVSGPEWARDRARPIFDAVGQKTIWVGAAGAGAHLKIVTNATYLTSRVAATGPSTGHATADSVA